MCACPAKDDDEEQKCKSALREAQPDVTRAWQDKAGDKNEIGIDGLLFSHGHNVVAERFSNQAIVQWRVWFHLR